MEELLPCVTVAEVPLNLDIEPVVVIGLIRPTAPEEVPNNYFTSLDYGVHYFFSRFASGIVTCQTKYDTDYYLFDSHSRGPKGFVAGEKGSSMVMKFTTEESLCRHLLIVRRYVRHGTCSTQ